MSKLQLFISISIFLIAMIIRTYAISVYPSGLNADEAALGYNAYSLLLTGRDEHGHSWPVNLESFGDFKPAFYAYLLIPFVKLLGLTEFAVRVPSAIFGALSVVLIYLFTFQVTKNYKISLFAQLLLTISPWHIHFSRGAWEVNLATTFILLGIWAFINWLNTHKFSWLAVCLVGLSLSLYAYQSARVIVPIMCTCLFIVYFPDLRTRLKHVFFGALVLIGLLAPLAYSILTSDATSRFSGVGFTSDAGPLNRVREMRGHYQNWNSLFSKVLHNSVQVYSLQFVKNYLDHFDPTFLFISGDTIERNRVPETGLVYIFDFVFVVSGIVYLVKHPSKFTKVIWIWLLVSPVAAGLTFQTPHALRAQNMVIPLVALIACGVTYVVGLTPKVAKAAICFLIIILYLWQFGRYLHEYYVHYPQEYPSAWEYGFKELVPFVVSKSSDYDNVYITDKYDQPYILFLFYAKVDPSIFQNNHQLTLRDKFNFSTVRQFGKYHFTSTPWDKMRDIHSTLIVAAPEDIPSVGVNVIKTINFPNNQPAFKIVAN